MADKKISELDELTTPSSTDVLPISHGEDTYKVKVQNLVPPVSSSLEDLEDVEITTPSDGDALVYDEENEKWVNGQGGGKQTALTQAEYDALVEAGTVDPTMEYFITDGIPSSVEYYHNYSTDEQVVGTWVDGSPVYEKTIYNAGGVNGTITIPHNITNMSKCIDLFGTCHDIGYGSQHDGEADMPLPRIATDGYNVGIAGVNTTNIIIALDSIWGDRIQDFYITLRYTKST